jgi:TPP-dependent pyruvate/acetoin dehydrogenase alpha subunit
MVKKKAKKKARKRLTPLQQIRKELDKLGALHEKEEAIVEKIEEIIDEEEEGAAFDLDKWEGTDPE